MSKIIIESVKKLQGTIEVPGDKSISHRAVMLGSLVEGDTIIKNFLMGEDCLSTVNAFKAMGVEITQKAKGKRQKAEIIVKGKGLRGLKKPKKELYLGNSGTTMRLLMGILAGQDFGCVLTGDESLSKRPMRRVAEPLRMMGAQIEHLEPKTPRPAGCRKSRGGQNLEPKTQELYPPLSVQGKYPLKAVDYKLPIASAQVKSAILLAGLYADGVTSVEEPFKSRDHTERMLEGLGADIKKDGLKVSIKRSALKSKGEIFVPGDISSAAFFMVAALILKSSQVTIRNLGVNPTRTGVMDILRAMGAEVHISSERGGAEPMADVTVSSSELKGVEISGALIPRAIDELPIIMVAAVFAKGTTVIKGAGELRVKETDRIASMTGNLARMGADIAVKGDDLIIKGTGDLRGLEVKSFGDHRTAMSLAVAGLAASGKTVVLDTACINTSFPEFEGLLGKLI